MTLEKMPTGKLESLRAEVEAMIATKVAERREELQSQLSRLLETSGSGNGRRSGHPKTRAVAVKYRNPKCHSAWKIDPLSRGIGVQN
jgi:hypothetical protein